MILLLTILLSLSPASSCAKQDRSPVRISVVRQQKFRNGGHHPESNRRVTFRMVNGTTKPVIVYGFRYEDGFDPTGYLIVLDKRKGEWTYPTGDNRPVSWNERSGEFKDKYTLLPGKAVTFDAEMSRLEVGEYFKRTVYVAFNDGEEPCEIRSEEFVLK